MRRRILSLFLVLCLCMCYPGVAFAEDNISTENQAEGGISVTEGSVDEMNLADAIKSAEKEGARVTLTGNVVLERPIDVLGTVVLDLNGYTITPAEGYTADYLISTNYGADLTIVDSSEEKTGTINSGDVMVAVKVTQKGVAAEKCATPAALTVKSGNIIGKYYAISGNGTRHNTEVVINGGHLSTTAENDGAVIYQPQAGTLTVNGGTLEGSTGIELRAGTLYVTGGQIIATGNPYSITANNNGTTTVGAGVAIVQHNTGLDINATISGGTISGAHAVVKNDIQGNNLDNVNFAITGGTFSDFTCLDYVAENANVNIVLANDVELGTSTITIPEGITANIDLNGHNIIKASTPYYLMDNYGTATIMDSVGSGLVKMDFSQNISSLIRNLGHCTIEGGNYYCNKIAVKNDEGSEGTYSTDAGEKCGLLTITGGTFTSKEQAVQNWGIATLEGGTFNSPVDTWACAENASKLFGETTINGGTFNGKVAAVQWYYSDKKGWPTQAANIVINGGNFNEVALLYKVGKPLDAPVYAEKPEGCELTGSITVNGGNFASDVSEFVADGKLCGKDGNHYVVGDAVAAIGNVQYATLESAVAAVEADGVEQTIKLLADTQGAGIQIQAGQNIVFNLNGHTYEVVNPLVGSAGTKTNGFQLLKGATVTFENGTLTSKVAKILLQNYCDLTLKNVKVDGSNLDGIAYALSNNHGNVRITGDTKIIAKQNGIAFDLWYGMSKAYEDGVTVTFDNNFTGSVKGVIEYGATNAAADWQSKAGLFINGGNFDTTFVASSTDALNGATIQINGAVFTDIEALNFLEEGGKATINLLNDTTVNHPLTINGDVIINLNGKTLNINAVSSLVKAKCSLTINNGTINYTGLADGTKAAFKAEKNAKIVVDGVTMITNGTAFFPDGNAAQLTISNSDITAGTYCVGTNATTDIPNIVINLKDSSFETTGYQENDGDDATLMINQQAKMSVDNCQITAHRIGLFVRRGEATIKNSEITFKGDFTGAAYDNNAPWKSGNEAVSAAVTVGDNSTGYEGTASLTIEGTTINAGANKAIFVSEDENENKNTTAYVNVVSGTVNGTLATQNGAALNVTGGTYTDANVANYVADNYAVTTTAGGYAVLPVAVKIGEASYVSVSDAMKAANSGDTITLVNDVEDTYFVVDQAKTGIVLDLNDKTLTINSANTSKVSTGAALTIENGTINYYGLANGTKAAFGAEENAAINVSGVTMNTSGAAFLPNGNAAQLTISNSNITAGTYCVGTNRSNDLTGINITLTDSTFATNGYDGADGDDAAVMMNQNGEMTISGCTINAHRIGLFVRCGNATVTDTTINFAADSGYYNAYPNGQTWQSGNEAVSAAVTVGDNVNGSYAGAANASLENVTINANDNRAIFVSKDENTAASVNVVSGTVNGTLATQNGANLSVAGGYFSTDVTEYVAAGKVCVEDGSGYVVYDKVAEIGTIGYASLEQAVAAANANDTITLVKDTTLTNNLDTCEAMNVDLNGQTLTINERATLTVCEDLTISNSKTTGGIAHNGTIAVVNDATLDISALADGEGGLLRGYPGCLTIAEDATVNYLTAWDVWEVGTTHPVWNFPRVAIAAVGAKAVIGGKTYTCVTAGDTNTAGQWSTEVVSIYDHLYGSLADAVNAATIGDQIMLLTDIVLGNNLGTDDALSVDLNGHTLTIANGVTLTVGANLTIDNTNAETGGIAHKGTIAVENNATLDISALADGEGGLLRGYPGCLTIANGATVNYLTAWNRWEVGTTHPVWHYPNVAIAEAGAKAVINETTYVCLTAGTAEVASTWIELSVDEANRVAASEVVNMIDYLGEATFTDEYIGSINYAEQAYNDLNDRAKAYVASDKLEALASAKADYETLKTQAENAESSINAIGPVVFTTECHEKITAARTTLEELRDNGQIEYLYEAIQTLNAAELAYDNLQGEVQSVTDLINAIGTVELTQESKEKIDEARTAYNALDANQQAYLAGTYTTLTAAEAAYAELEAQIAEVSGGARYKTLAEAVAAAKANDTITLVKAAALAGNLEINKALNIDLNGQTLTINDGVTLTVGANLTISNSAPQGGIDHNGTIAVVNNATLDILRLADGNGGLLQGKPGCLTIANGATVKYLAAWDQYAVGNNHPVTHYPRVAIAELGAKAVIKNTTYVCIGAGTVDNASTWIEETLDQANRAAAANVVARIDAIGTPEFTDTCKNNINRAEGEYNNLNPNAKAYVPVEKLEILNSAMTQYTGLKSAADAVRNSINAIGPVVLTAEYKAQLDAANAAYNALDANQKAYLASDYVTLTNAETAYAELEQTIQNVVDQINAIGTVAYTDASKALIDAARSAYDNLTEAQQTYVTADQLKVLTDAEALYPTLRPTRPSGPVGPSGPSTPSVIINEPDVPLSDAPVVKTEEKTDAAGNMSKTIVDINGKQTSNVTISEQAAKAAVEKDEAIVLPVPEVKATAASAESGIDNAPQVNVVLPKGTEKAKVSIPVAEATNTTVLMKLNEDGTYSPVPLCTLSADGIQANIADGTYIVVDNKATFNDVADTNWYASGANFAAARNLMIGTGEGNFGAKDTLKIAQTAAVIARLGGADTQQSWNDAVAKYGNTDISSREGTASMFYDAYKAMGGKNLAATGDLSVFTDFTAVTENNLEAMKWAIQIGLLQGDDKNALDPQGELNRAQFGTILERFVNLLSK